ncbi:hypothetical protein VRU48_07100 [Pedobacter sp. KR3-3]|uniref:Ig-like domain-containing protein n=1 Tax=Pedobacter albus TaxID=3113905 RepID=A0ABU7I5X7_9SPHI|nr:hypothetical protein [Pedobacter sp. KR3-3]MEE1944865.1 hypothetical protein [Pedobacter sp. KR3-3]
MMKLSAIGKKQIFKIKLTLLFLVFGYAAAAQEQTMYWIGGAGNWGDLTHWSFQSGTQGPTTPSSIPTSETNVIINAASGFSGSAVANSPGTIINLTANVFIKSLTFESDLTASNSPRIVGSFGLAVSGNATLRSTVMMVFGGAPGNGFTLDQLVGTIATLKLNGTTLGLDFVKKGAGTLNIEGNFDNSGDTYINNGITNYNGTVFQSGGFLMNNDALLNMPSLRTLNFTAYRGQNINGTASLNVPLLQTINTKGFTLNSTTPLNLPSLQVFNAEGVVDNGNPAATLALANGAVVTAFNWSYIGNLSAGTAQFHITGNEFKTKSATTVNKVFIDNTNQNATVVIAGAGSTINELFFTTSGGYFLESMYVGKLRLAPSANYLMQFNSELAVTGQLVDSTPNCTGFYQIYAYPTGYTTKLNNQTGAPINLTNARISGINVLTQTVNVVGVDNGGNTGLINFTQPPTKDIYWVGAGADNQWNTKMNWSASSGGAGGYCIPSQYDNVFFDANSVVTGATVNITGSPAYFRNITIQDNFPQATFALGSANNVGINCYGSWYMKSGVSVNDVVYFYAPSLGETITSNNSVFTKNIHFRGLGGWVLQDKLTTGQNLYFNSGTLNTNSKEVYIAENFSPDHWGYPMSPGNRHLIFGSSAISALYLWEYPGGGTLDAGTSHIIMRNPNGSFNAGDSYTYYDVTVSPAGNAQRIGYDFSGPNINYHNIYVYSSYASFVQAPNNTANLLKAMPVLGRAELYFQGNFTTNAMEVQASAIISANSGVTLTINQNFISHTADCMGLMEMYVNNKTPGQSFTFKALNNVNIPNVWMTGVTADLTTGKTYTATGIQGPDVNNWTFVPTAPKELYWTGASDSNWNNGLNWTTNTNGTPTLGGCVPTRYDNVHFNSFSNRNLPINILNIPAYFNNLIAHADAPDGIAIVNDVNTIANAYGNTIQLGSNMYINRLTLQGDANNGVLTTSQLAKFDFLTVNSPTANWIFNGNIKFNNKYIQTGATVTANATLWDGNAECQLNGVALNLNVQTINLQGVWLQKGDFKASGLTMNLTQDFVSNDATNPRSVDIRNSNITVRSWFHSNLATATLQAGGSTINVLENFNGKANDVYGKIIVPLQAYLGSGYYIQGGIIADELILNQSRTINDNNTFGTLFLKPTGLTLNLQTGSTQAVANYLLLSGSPCYLNSIRVGGETGSSQTTQATINYSNPNNSNKYDFIRIGGIIASNAHLLLYANSTQLGNNQHVEEVVPGQLPGLIGLPDNFSCATINDADSATYQLVANFVGGPTSSYTWFKKDAGGTFVNLNVPTTTTVIDVRNFGYDGVYKAEIIYDPSLPIAQQCKVPDEITVSYKPKNVVLSAGANAYRFCANDSKTIANLSVDVSTANEMALRVASIKWYATAAGGAPLNPADLLVSGDYYAELVVDATGCVSPTRTLAQVLVEQPMVANAGPDQQKGGNYPITFTMVANDPQTATGEWIVISGNISIADNTKYNTTISLNSGNRAELQWRITNSCGISTDNVLLIKMAPVMANPSLRTRVKQ